MTLDTLESIIWSQARHLTSPDGLTARTAMDAIRVAITAHVEEAVVLAATDHPSVVAKRRRALREATALDDPALRYAGLPVSRPQGWEMAS